MVASLFALSRGTEKNMADIFDLFKQIQKKPEEVKPITHLVVGLGNPGAQYRHTRHNAGFAFIDYLCETYGVHADRARFSSLCGEAAVGEARVLLMRPQTMMNLSGKAVAEAAGFYHIPTENIIVVFDDVSLDVGRLRVRRKGTHGGHNGIRSIIECLGSDAFPRIKVGVGQKPHPDYDLAAWVLGDLSAEERKQIWETFRRAEKGLCRMLGGDVEGAMQICNAAEGERA